jgi:LysM repeat protein
MTKRIFQIAIILGVLLASLAPAGAVSAWTGCSGYVTVQWGDTLSGLAKQCGTTVEAIRAANPGLGWWLYAGQVIYMPTGYVPAPTYGGTYVVKSGDTLGKIAARIGVSWRDILAVNPQIQNPSLIYVGQVINLPAGVVVPPPPVYTPPPADCTCCNCQPDGVDSWATLKIAYGPGMFIRSEPGGPVLLASAMDNTTWYYKLNSVFVDKRWRVWVEVKLYPPVKGYSTGWLLVRDQLGKYFTKPQIDN